MYKIDRNKIKIIQVDLLELIGMTKNPKNMMTRGNFTKFVSQTKKVFLKKMPQQLLRLVFSVLPILRIHILYCMMETLLLSLCRMVILTTKNLYLWIGMR